MTIHHHKFYGIDKQNRVRLKIAITIILDVLFIILNSFWYKSVNETLNIKAAVRGLKMPPLFWSTCEEAGKPLICWYLSSVEYSWFTVIWSEFYRSWQAPDSNILLPSNLKSQNYKVVLLSSGLFIRNQCLLRMIWFVVECAVDFVQKKKPKNIPTFSVICVDKYKKCSIFFYSVIISFWGPTNSHFKKFVKNKSKFAPKTV